MSRFWIFLMICVFLPVVLHSGIPEDEELIGKRGDANNDDKVDHSDIIFIANYLNNGGNEPPCLVQADSNDELHHGSILSYEVANQLFVLFAHMTGQLDLDYLFGLPRFPLRVVLLFHET